MRKSIIPKSETLQLFKTDIWKDQRRLEKTTIDGQCCLVKYYKNPGEAQREKTILRHLADNLTPSTVPRILDEGYDYVVLPYLHGIRIFNLFVELDRIDPPLNKKAYEIKKRILKRCDKQQHKLQEVLQSWHRGREAAPYPIDKIMSIIRILADCLGILVDYTALTREIEFLRSLWDPAVYVPFRDATTKNMVLADSSLWLGTFESEEARRVHLCQTLRATDLPDWVEAPIYDFDFASCVHDTTPEDDVISLRYHERTWLGPPVEAKSLVWNCKPDSRRAALTFLVRYYRFGGRKAAYRLLHPTGHRIRFRHDNDVFYFEKLPGIMMRLWPESRRYFPEILSFTETVTRYLKTPLTKVDLFLARGMQEQRRYYVDMYPE